MAVKPVTVTVVKAKDIDGVVWEQSENGLFKVKAFRKIKQNYFLKRDCCLRRAGVAPGMTLLNVDDGGTRVVGSICLLVAWLKELCNAKKNDQGGPGDSGIELVFQPGPLVRRKCQSKPKLNVVTRLRPPQTSEEWALRARRTRLWSFSSSSPASVSSTSASLTPSHSPSDSPATISSDEARHFDRGHNPFDTAGTSYGSGLCIYATQWDEHALDSPSTVKSGELRHDQSYYDPALVFLTDGGTESCRSATSPP